MDKQRIGFIGLGNMGGGMACRLAEAGYEIAVWNRTRSKADPVAELGARVADSPADAAASADVVMTSLADDKAVTSVLFGADGAFESLREGGYLVDLSTVPPGFARELPAGERGGPARARRLRSTAPLAGPERRAARDGRRRERGRLPCRRGRSCEAIGKDVAYLGESGMGAMMKLVLNMLMGVQMPALAEAVVFGEQAGLPRERILRDDRESGYARR